MFIVGIGHRTNLVDQGIINETSTRAKKENGRFCIGNRKLSKKAIKNDKN